MSIEKEYSTKAKQLETFFGKVCGQYAHESGLVKGNRIWLTDSSQLRLPDALAAYFSGSGRGNATASMKMTVSYEFLSGRFEAIEIEAGKRPDQTNPMMNLAIAPGMLVITDLGFFNQSRFAEFDQEDVYFLSRLNLQAGVYEQIDSSKSIDLA